MNKLHLMQVFVAVAEEAGFAAGARRLGMSPPAVTRSISNLEDNLGVQLLSRTTRYVRATESGQRYLEDARRIIAEVNAADEAVAGINAAPRGHLAVTAPVLFGRMFVTPCIIDYLNRYADTSISAIFLDRVVNLLEEGFEVGVRIGELADSSMRALRVGQVRLVVCASPRYLEHNGTPHLPKDLTRHSIITSSASSRLSDWRFKTPANDQTVRIESRLTVTSNDAAIEAAIGHLGITRLLSYQIAPLLMEGKLRTILVEHESVPLPIHIIHRQGRNESAKVRAFVDLIAKRLREDPALQS
ncbi:MAG TPA: LysR family transcriptional regulator [Gammaproteobacteria bacterium]|nr:LysR family transcriptional regulator [Gammaproteobacteria bacterium]